MKPIRCLPALLAGSLLLPAVPATAQCLLDGTYDSDPVTSYACCVGLISFSVGQWDLTIAGNQVLVAPVPPGSIPSALVGTIDCQSGTFTATASVPGGCTETYTLQGQILSPGNWSGTFYAQYSGPDCSCFGGMFGTPCTSQQFAVAGSLPATAIRPGAPPSFARLDVGPNPFSASTTVRVRVERSEAASLVVLDVAGRTVATLFGGATLDRGDHEFSWARRTDDGRRAPTGIYFVRLRTASTERVAKVLVLD
jgi:hypothetical protein